MSELIHPAINDVVVPGVISLALESGVREIPLKRGDGDVYYKLGKPAFALENKGYAAFPLEITSQAARDELGSHTVELFVFHHGANMEPLELTDATATICDLNYSGSGTALGFDLTTQQVETWALDDTTQASVLRPGKVLTYYANSPGRGLGFVSLCRPAFYDGIEIPLCLDDERLSDEYRTVHARFKSL